MKGRLGLADVLDRLPGNGLGQEADEIAGMSRLECHADLAVLLHAADARAVSGARVEHDEGPLGPVVTTPFGGLDPHQEVVHGPRKRTAVQDEIRIEAEDVRHCRGCLFLPRIAALAERIREERPALHRVDPVGCCRLHEWR